MLKWDKTKKAKYKQGKNLMAKDYMKTIFEDAQSEDKLKKAFEEASTIRRFEINLYWERAKYFSVILGSIFIAYFTFIGNRFSQANPKHNLYAMGICLLGLLISFAWLLGNKGSKFWARNWEAHIDFLEESQVGNIYKNTIDYGKIKLSH